MSNSDSLLELRNVQVSFGGNKVLTDLDLAVTRGFNGLIGPNGAGKTTAFNVVSGYVTPQGGSVIFDGRDITGMRPVPIARLGMGRTFQTPKLVPTLTLVENVMLGLDGRPGKGSAKRPAALEILTRFGLEDLAQKKAESIPIALQKVVEIARGLVGAPKFLMLDEPAAGLSTEDVERVLPPLREIVEETGVSVLIIEHDIELVRRLCHTTSVLHFGKNLVSGNPSDVMRHPEVLEAYLGAPHVA